MPVALVSAFVARQPQTAHEVKGSAASAGACEFARRTRSAREENGYLLLGSANTATLSIASSTSLNDGAQNDCALPDGLVPCRLTASECDFRLEAASQRLATQRVSECMMTMASQRDYLLPKDSQCGAGMFVAALQNGAMAGFLIGVRIHHEYGPSTFTRLPRVHALSFEGSDLSRINTELVRLPVQSSVQGTWEEFVADSYLECIYYGGLCTS